MIRKWAWPSILAPATIECHLCFETGLEKEEERKRRLVVLFKGKMGVDELSCQRYIELTGNGPQLVEFAYRSTILSVMGRIFSKKASKK